MVVSFSNLSRRGDHHPIDFTGVTEFSREKSPPAKLGDEELVALAQKGDSKAFEDLVERYKQRAYRIAFDFTEFKRIVKNFEQDLVLYYYGECDIIKDHSWRDVPIVAASWKNCAFSFL